MIRKRALYPLCVLAYVFLASGCATIVYGSKQAIPINSNPTGAYFEIYRLENGALVYNGTTPDVVTLPRATAYFKRAEYRLVIKLDGHEDVEINILNDDRLAWYLAGNLFSWNIFGWLVLDPITGALYELIPGKINVNLTPIATTATENASSTLNIVTMDYFSAEALASMDLIRIE